MRVLPDLSALPASRPLVATVGVFDGLHRGHLRVVAATVREARRRGAASAIISFEPHPDALLRGAPPLLLLDPRERAARLAAAGVDLLVRQRFDADLAGRTADAFVRAIDGPDLLRALVMTDESAFGHRRGGTAVALGPLGRELGFSVIRVPELIVGGERVSDSRIRALVAAGRLAAAARLLGRPHAVTATVVRGDGRGRQLGFPTANLGFREPVALPPDGIYAVHASWGGTDPLRPHNVAAGVASLGVRPTFGPGARVLEVYLLVGDPDLYGQRLHVEFVRRQRGERRFSSVTSLVAQMTRDVARTRELLAHEAGEGPTRTDVLDSARHS